MSNQYKIARWKCGVVVLALLVAWQAVAVGRQATSKAAADHTPLYWAELLARKVKPADTSYRHQDSVVTWRGVNGAEDYVSHTDCSGLINALLAQSYGLTREDFKRWLGKPRPFASTYHEAITAQNGFRRIERVGEIRPGDLIAIRYPDGSENTGHIMIVAETPLPREASKPVVKDTEQWEARVIDSSRSGHGKTDTRRLDDGTFRQGVGSGALRLYADRRGSIVGYSWSDFGASEFYSQDERNLVVGRQKL
jgi:hypothetical protein